MRIGVALLAAGSLAVTAGLAAGQPAILPGATPRVVHLQPGGLNPRIVNGVSAVGEYPPVGLLYRFDIGSYCTGTLVGCHTFLTAAHCLGDDFNPAGAVVFFQHRGFFAVSTGAMHPEWDTFVRSDIALITLAADVSGIAPARINNVAKPPLGTAGDIVGFGSVGSVGGGVPFNFAGILRRGDVVTASCATVPESSHVCFSFQNPLGPPGDDSSTCFGDSGGPLFTTVGGIGTAVTGVASGVNSTDCLPPAVPFHADVNFDRDWIQGLAAGDLAPLQCSALPTALGPGTAQFVDTFSMTEESGGVLYMVTLGPGFSQLVITTNGEVIPSQNYDLYVNLGSPPAPGDFDCASTTANSLEACLFNSPVAGDYYVQVDNSSGSEGEYQLTVAAFGTAVPTWTPTPTPPPSRRPRPGPGRRAPTRTTTPTSTPTRTPTSSSNADADSDAEQHHDTHSERDPDADTDADLDSELDADLEFNAYAVQRRLRCPRLSPRPRRSRCPRRQRGPPRQRSRRARP